VFPKLWKSGDIKGKNASKHKNEVTIILFYLAIKIPEFLKKPPLPKAKKHPHLDGDFMYPKCYHKYQFCLYLVLKNDSFLQKMKYFSEIF
jgi:hypothetical protein